MTTSQLARELDEPIGRARNQLIRMHHLGMIEPIGVRQEDRMLNDLGYFQDVLWDLTVHTREHRGLEPGCRACLTRQLLLAAAEALGE